jgi:hypothetical protein
MMSQMASILDQRVAHSVGSPSHLGIAVLIVPSGSFFHAQTNVSVDITEELSPNVREIHSVNSDHTCVLPFVSCF